MTRRILLDALRDLLLACLLCAAVIGFLTWLLPRVLAGVRP